MKRASALSLLLALGLLATACAGSHSTSDSSSSEIIGEEAVLEFTACLRDEGLNVDDPAIDADGNLVPPTPHAVAAKTLDMSAVHSAFDVCQEILESVTFDMSTEDQTQREDELLEFAICMRENGYEMDDPNFSEDGHSGAGPFGDDLDADDPDFISAAESCEGIIGG